MHAGLALTDLATVHKNVDKPVSYSCINVFNKIIMTQLQIISWEVF